MKKRVPAFDDEIAVLRVRDDRRCLLPAFREAKASGLAVPQPEREYDSAGKAGLIGGAMSEKSKVVSQRDAAASATQCRFHLHGYAAHKSF